MNRSIFYYVHHQGRGHLDRALSIARHAPDRFVLLGTGLAGQTGEVHAIDLEDDQPLTIATRPMPHAPALHYAPTDHPGIRSRVAAITAAIATHAPGLIAVDVSVEVGLLAAIASVPLVYVRLAGDRSDPPHDNIFRAADHLIAPFHRDLDDPDTPAWVIAKTRYAPGLTSAQPRARHESRRILVVAGKGSGASFDGSRIAAAARATPEYQWICIGPVSRPPTCPANVAITGWCSRPDREVAAADIVIGAAGDGLVSAVLAVNRPFICLPEDRPYREQHVKAAGLARAGAAIVLHEWPAPAAWPDLLTRARHLDPAVPARLHDGSGAAGTAAHLIAMADRA